MTKALILRPKFLRSRLRLLELFLLLLDDVVHPVRLVTFPEHGAPVVDGADARGCRDVPEPHAVGRNM